MTDPVCFLDVDGVVADLCGALAVRFKRPVSTWPRGDYDLSRILGFESHGALWNDLGHEFWAMLPLTPWARDLVSLVDAEFGCHRVVFVTVSELLDPGCASGKAVWLREHFPGRAWFIGPNKAVLARPGALLIDDADVNVAAWQDRDGPAILLPARWNARHKGEGDPLASVDADMRLWRMARDTVCTAESDPTSDCACRVCA